MKTTQNFKKNYLLFILAGSLFLGAAQCEKDKNIPEIDKLPPPTQIGADTFGCLVDGKAFMPRKSGWFGGPVLQCNYQYINSGNLHGYYFVLRASDFKSYSDGTHSLGITADSVELEQKTYSLDENNVNGKLSGLFSIITVGTNVDYATTLQSTGELTITRLDDFNQIMSGTFWFDAVNKDGIKVEVREGRFDVHFVK